MVIEKSHEKTQNEIVHHAIPLNILMINHIPIRVITAVTIQGVSNAVRFLQLQNQLKIGAS